MSWMAWTVPTALFFLGVGLSLIAMTFWQVRSPSVPRRGFLPIVTSRGDRFFISLLTAAYIHAAWLAATDASVLIASALSVLAGAALMRWG